MFLGALKFSLVIINDASDKKSSVQLTIGTHKILAPDLNFLQQVEIYNLLHQQLQD